MDIDPPGYHPHDIMSGDVLKRIAQCAWEMGSDHTGAHRSDIMPVTFPAELSCADVPDFLKVAPSTPRLNFRIARNQA
jgi:hypothetical protein